MDPFFIKLQEKRERSSRPSPEVEANRIVTELKDRIGDFSGWPQGTASASSTDLNPLVQTLVRERVGEVQITQIVAMTGFPVITYRVTW